MKEKNGKKRKTSFFTVTIIIMTLFLFPNPITLAGDQIIVSFDPRPNEPPVIHNNEYPANTSTNIEIQTTCHITVSDGDGDTMTIYWYENSTGNWVLRQTNTLVNNGIYYWNFTQATNYFTMYYWKVSVNDSVTNTTAIYHFTTKPQPSTPSPDPGDGYFPPPNKYPIANITGPAVRYVGKTVIFCAYYSYDTDGFITGYRWDYNNDGLFDTDWSEDLFTTYIYYIAGNYTVKLQVKDDDGARSTDSYVINIIELGVNQHPPIANASGPYEAFINEDITFNATGSYDPDGTIVLYFWDFGNHNISNLKNPVYSYSKPGDYIVILTVIDNDNLTNSAVATVHIKDNETEERERRQPLSCLLFLLIIIIVIVIVTIFFIRNDKFVLLTKSDKHKNRYIKSVTDKSLKKLDKKSHGNIDAKVDKILLKPDKTKKKK